MASNVINNFVEDMKSLGYSLEDMIDLINKM